MHLRLDGVKCKVATDINVTRRRPRVVDGCLSGLIRPLSEVLATVYPPPNASEVMHTGDGEEGVRDKPPILIPIWYRKTMPNEGIKANL